MKITFDYLLIMISGIVEDNNILTIEELYNYLEDNDQNVIEIITHK